MECFLKAESNKDGKRRIGSNKQVLYENSSCLEWTIKVKKDYWLRLAIQYAQKTL